MSDFVFLGKDLVDLAMSTVH